MKWNHYQSLIILAAFIIKFVNCAPMPPLDPIAKSRQHTQIGKNLFKNNQLIKAEREFRLALKLYNKNDQASEFLALILWQTNRYLEAERMAQYTLQLNPSSGVAHFVLAGCLFKKRELKAALEEIRRALALLKRPVKKRKAEELLAQIQAELTQGKKQEDDWLNLGLKYFNQENWEQAERFFRKELKRKPESLRAQEYLALILLRRGYWEEAARIAKKIIARTQKSAIAYFVLGYVLKLKKDQLNSAPLLAKAKQLADDKRIAIFERFRKEEPQLIKKVGSSTLSEKKVIPPEQRLKIAVFPFENANALTEELKLGESVSEMLITALINTQCFNVIERSQLNKLLEEQKLSQSGAIDTETAVEVGKVLGCDGVVIVSISKLDRVIEADARLIEVTTAQALLAVSGRSNSIDQLRGMAEQMAKELAQKAQALPVKEKE